MSSIVSLSSGASEPFARPRERLVKGSDIEKLIQHIADFYDIGTVTKYSEIGVGYEDCNVIIEAHSGKYVAKLFAQTRTSHEIERYIAIMEKITAAGIRHPELVAGQNGKYVLHHSGVWAVLACFVEGKTFYELGRAPTADERHEILEQMARLNKIDHEPFYIPGSWVMERFDEMLTQVQSHLSDDQINMLTEAKRRYDKIPVDKLERTFIHSDIRTTNVLLGDDGKIYLIDYFLANNFLRIREMSVAIASLFCDLDSTETIEQLCRAVVDKYGDFPSEEYQYLVSYVLSIFAIEFLGGTYARYVQNNQTDENSYWLERGRNGMRKCLAEKQK
ncbi:MAG: phosphotransferase [bacterium]|nr:phosphotransferase [bacterium]MDN5835335.1 phosphotransferase [bacterium]